MAGEEPPPYTREDLDGMGCGRIHPEGEMCHHDEGLYLFALCHPEAGLSVHYKDGALRIRCHVCFAIVGVIAVADE